MLSTEPNVFICKFQNDMISGLHLVQYVNLEDLIYSQNILF